MLIQYLKFFINGGMLGVVAWGVQFLIYKLLGDNSTFHYGLATVLTYVSLIGLNFLIQRRWIFDREGVFWRFVLANLLIMVLVTALSSILRMSIANSIGWQWGDRLAFVIASLVGSIPSFFLKKTWVFRDKRF